MIWFGLVIKQTLLADLAALAGVFLLLFCYHFKHLKVFTTSAANIHFFFPQTKAINTKFEQTTKKTKHFLGKNREKKELKMKLNR